MASLFSENFEGASNGATATTSNTGFSSFTGSGSTFSSAPTPIPQGSLALQIAAASGTDVYGAKTVTATGVLYARFYLRPPASLTGAVDVLATRGSNSPRNRVHLNANRTVSLLNGSTVVWTSTTALPGLQWSRVEVRVDNSAGQQQARLYVSASNPHTTTATEDSGNRTYNQGTIDTVRLGQINSATTAATTVHYDAVALDNAAWIGPAVVSTPTITAVLSGSGTLTATLTAPSNTISAQLAGTGTLSVLIEAVPVPTPPPSHIHRWAAFSRDTSYAPSQPLPIIAIKAVLKHVDVSTAIVTTPFSPAAWDATTPSTGVILYRDGVQKFDGPITARQLNWDAEQGRPQIVLECVGDEQHLADRLAMPDPLRAGDDQTVNDYWQRSGVAASTAMWQLISDQAGPTCRPDRQVSGLVMGTDPGVGAVRTYQFLFDNVMTALATISAVSGADLGVRVRSVGGGLVVDVVQPRDVSDSVKFAADLRNLVSIFYRETAPTVTHGLSAGQGDLHARLRSLVVTASSLALVWGRQIWSYVDRRDTADVPTLQQASQDDIDQGAPTVSLTVTLTDSQAATYGVDWDLGDKVTVFVGLPGQAPAVTVVDVIRQISIDVDNRGQEVIQPAIGSYDAKAILPTPTQEKLAATAAALSGLIRRP